MHKDYEASLKSIETENIIDRIFYRPVGFVIARRLIGTGVTPNMVTVASIFAGVTGGALFYPDNIYYNLCGILCLIYANILDCVDGQLARLTGFKSAFGRILDGVAGDLWFLSIYLGLAFRLHDIYGSYCFIGIAFVSGFSHLFQANITDYYKTLHLYFISKEKGQEFQAGIPPQSSRREEGSPLSGRWGGFLFFLYYWYTMLQVKTTPSLQKMLCRLKERYGDDIPENIRLAFRKQSCRLMKCYIDWLTFNGRTVILFTVVLTGHVWIYFLYEIIVLNIVLAIAVSKHEKMCRMFILPN